MTHGIRPRSFAAGLLLAFTVAPAALAIESRPTPPPAPQGDLTVRVAGPAHLAEGERVTSLIVLEGDATVEGTVEDTLFVANGDAYVTGHVLGEATIVNGRLRLGPGASVSHVSLVNGALDTAPGAVVGSIERSEGWRWNLPFAAFTFAMWLGLTLLVLVAGWIYVAIAPRAVGRARAAMLETPGQSALGALVVVLALPLLSVPLFATGIGIPLALGVLLVLVPALLFFGFLTAGIALGVAAVAGLKRGPTPPRPGVAATVGLLALQVVGAIPFVGAIVVGVASLWGAGALAVLAFRAAGRRQAGEGAAAAG